MGEAVGFLEVYGLTAAFMAADAACKAGNITIEAFDNNKPANAEKLKVPLIVIVKIRGSIEDVKAGIEAGITVASEVSGVVSSHVIARPEKDTEKLLKLQCFKK
ncbi:BMC domain-containing protein [Natronincola peptidivorans]|uniref:BMC domain-containing protein n=1 Tax=Natronincola peptidivorans TaxID=426128 RepID=A0A1I0CFY0_9FIRM|nr:BMC domain-containing protein [Natronincola peptidivorans]SET18318.1 BMC domain-containing protein [Natronincola peptidivorans]